MTFYAHTLTWEDLVRLSMRREPIITAHGHLLSSRDREFIPNAAGFTKYCEAVDIAVEKGNVIPFGVRAAHELRKVEGELGVREVKTLKSKAARAKQFAWSFTAIQQNETCPNQYAAERFYGLVKFVENEHSRWGNRVHKALELRLKQGSPLPKAMAQWEKYCAKFDKVVAELGATLYSELQLTVTRNFHLTGWYDADAFGRCALDVCIDAGDVVYIYDWKTGKKKDNELQLKTCAAFAALNFPKAKRFVVKYIWLQEEGARATSGTDINVSEIQGIWNLLVEKIAQMELSWATEEFDCNPSGLCHGWCGHVDCPHWKPKI